MTHTNSRFSIASLSVFSVGIAAVCMLGCGADITPNAETDGVGSTTEALNGKVLIIRYVDDRPSTFFQVGITAVDQSNGGFYGGNATVPGPLTPGSTGADTMKWTENGLSQITYVQDTAFIGIFDQSTAPHRFTTMRVSVLATINGACHSDYENIDLSQGVNLYFNGEGASWNGSCWVGDLLHH